MVGDDRVDAQQSDADETDHHRQDGTRYFALVFPHQFRVENETGGKERGIGHAHDEPSYQEHGDVRGECRQHVDRAQYERGTYDDFLAPKSTKTREIEKLSLVIN